MSGDMPPFAGPAANKMTNNLVERRTSIGMIDDLTQQAVQNGLTQILRLDPGDASFTRPTPLIPDSQLRSDLEEARRKAAEALQKAQDLQRQLDIMKEERKPIIGPDGPLRDGDLGPRIRG